MKSIKYLAACIISSAIALSASQAKASEMCSINASNVREHTSTYNLFGDAPNSPLRPFSNPQYYSIGNGTYSAPIYYTAVKDGVAVAFDIKGKLAGTNIGKDDSVIQYFAAFPHTQYVYFLGTCVNGRYFRNGQRTNMFLLYDLAPGTQSAIQEAKYSISQESIGNMFK